MKFTTPYQKKIKSTYTNVKKALLCHFGKSENNYRREFHEIRIKMDKDPQIIVHEAQVKLTKWLELTTIDITDPKAILDMILIDTFLENATPELYTYLAEKKIRTQAQLTSALRTFKESHPEVEMDKRQDFLATIKNKETGIICYYCNKPGHMARHCYHNKRQTNRMSPKGSPTRYKTEWRDAQSHLANNRYNQNSRYIDNVPDRQSWRNSKP